MNSSHPNEKSSKGRFACACDSDYAKSPQGICKVLALILGLIAFIVVGASPYSKAIFLLEGVTWPFHVVMFLTILAWVLTAVVYGLFLSGLHLKYPHFAWPSLELGFNVSLFIIILIDAIIEATNVWRWDMSERGSENPLFPGGSTSSGSFNPVTYCQNNPTDCDDFRTLQQENKSYYGNHIFACVVLFLLTIVYVVASWFAFRVWRIFKQNITSGPAESSRSKSSGWERFRYRMAALKENVTDSNIRERVNKLLHHDDFDEEEGNSVDVEISSDTKPPKKKNEDAVAMESENRSHYSRSSSRHGSERKSRSASRRNKDDSEEISSRHGSRRNGSRREDNRGSRREGHRGSHREGHRGSYRESDRGSHRESGRGSRPEDNHGSRRKADHDSHEDDRGSHREVSHGNQLEDDRGSLHEDDHGSHHEHRHESKRSDKPRDESRSPRSGSPSRASHRKGRHGSSNRNKPKLETEDKQPLVVDMKNISNATTEDDGQVASIMC